MTNIQPTTHGPTAFDLRAWSRTLAEAIAFDQPVPAALLAGESTATGWSPKSFAYNAAWRLLHAPSWLGGCLAAALLLATLFFLRADRPRRRHRRGLCPTCGYNLRGLPAIPQLDGNPPTCPECGNPAPV